MGGRLSKSFRAAKIALSDLGRVLEWFQTMSDKALKMVTCGSCETKVFIPGDLPPLGTVPCSKCGHPIMMPMMLRQFELRSFVASGGMGTVYRGWDTVLERLVAVKLMKKELLEDPTAMEGFYREARACARLNHTNIIHIYTFDEWEGLRYLCLLYTSPSPRD